MQEVNEKEWSGCVCFRKGPLTYIYNPDQATTTEYQGKVLVITGLWGSPSCNKQTIVIRECKTDLISIKGWFTIKAFIMLWLEVMTNYMWYKAENDIPPHLDLIKLLRVENILLRVAKIRNSNDFIFYKYKKAKN